MNINIVGTEYVGLALLQPLVIDGKNIYCAEVLTDGVAAHHSIGK